MARDIVTNLIANDKASRPLHDMADAAEDAADSLDELSLAERRAALEAEKARVKVDKATTALTRAEERHGRESLQARDASLRLRSAELDLAEAEEKLSHRARKAAEDLDDAGDAAEHAGRRFDGLKNRMGFLGNVARHVTGLSLVTAGTQKLGGALGPLVPGLARAGAGLAAFGAVTLTAAPAVLGLATAVGHLALTVGPASASLPALAGGVLFLQRSLISTGPAMAQAFDPVTAAFSKGQAEVDKLATHGLPALARQFVRVNFPAIHDAMTEIAETQNAIVTSVGKWINSAHGQELIRTTTQGISGAFRELRPELTGVLISFGELARRGGDRGIDLLATGIQRAATAATRFMDSISSQDIDTAWTKVDRFTGALGQLPGALSTAYGALQQGIGWWRAHEDAINATRDALAGVAIVVGVATGGWLIALGGALTLIQTHWSEVRSAVSGVVTWFDKATAAGGQLHPVMSALSGIVSDLSSWFSGKLLPALRQAGSDLMPTLKDAAADVTKSFNDNKDSVDKAKRIFDAIGVVLTKAVIPGLTVMAEVAIPAVVTAFDGVLTALNKVVLPGIRIFTKVALDAMGGMINGAADFTEAFGLPLAGKLRKAADKFNVFRAEVNQALDGIRDHQVNVTINTRYRNFGTPAGTVVPEWYGKRAAGGPVMMGRPYLVGERGPELFVPGISGGILDAMRTASLFASGARPVAAQPVTASAAPPMRAGGGTTTIKQETTININATGSDLELENRIFRAIHDGARRGRLRAVGIASLTDLNGYRWS